MALKRRELKEVTVAKQLGKGKHGQQVVIAADRPPADLESLDDRVRSRLAGGLVVSC